MTQAEVEILYSKHLDLIRKVVWEFINLHGLPPSLFEELFSQANLYFMIATIKYDGAIAEFSTWLYIQIWGRLRSQRKKDIWEWNNLKLYRERYKENTPHTHIRDGKKKNKTLMAIASKPPIFLDLLDEVSKDTKILLALICKGELDELLFTDTGLPERKHGLKYMYRFLREWGWSRKRINICYRNIREILK